MFSVPCCLVLHWWKPSSSDPAWKRTEWESEEETIPHFTLVFVVTSVCFFPSWNGSLHSVACSETGWKHWLLVELKFTQGCWSRVSTNWLSCLLVSRRVQALPAAASVTSVQLAALAISKGISLCVSWAHCSLDMFSWGLCSPVTWGSDSGKLLGAFTVMVSWSGWRASSWESQNHLPLPHIQA